MRYWIIGLVLLVALIIIMGGNTIVIYLVRNLRNHNPGNIRISDNAWEGKVPENQNTDGTFEQFQDYNSQPADYWGIRALGINALALYQGGATTLDAFGEAWVPASDNGGVSDYGARLATQLGVSDSSQPYDIPGNLAAVACAVTVNEGGVNPYSSDLVAQAISSSLQEKGY